MKKYFAKGKTVAATAMAALLVSTTAFAAEKPQESIPATEILTIEEAQALEAQKEKELTFEEAVELATKNSSDLRSVAETADYLQDLKEDIWDITGSFSVPTVSYQQWVDDDIYAIYSSIQNISSSMTKNRYSEELTKISLEATVKNYYTSIFSDQSSLELAKKDMEVKKTLWEQGQRKNQLGLLSDYDLNTLRSDYEQAQYNVAKLEMALEQEYLSHDFIYGNNPRYNIICKRRIDNVGDMEIRIEMKNDIIKSINLMGDFFITGDIDAKIIKPLMNTPLERTRISEALPETLNDVIHNLEKDDFISLILQSKEQNLNS